MAEGLVEPSPFSSSSKRSSDVVALPPASDCLFQRRIAFHLERKPYSPISTSGGSFNLETLNPTVPSAAAPDSAPAETMLPGSGKRSDGGLDPELSFRINFRRIGAGLANLGNTCFLNSVLQCLTYTEPFAAYLQSGKHKSSCRTHGFCAMCALQNHVMNALQSTGKILSPSHLVKNLRCISRNFRNSRQEDAHEYMVNLLESMHKCCLPSGVPTESSSAYEKSLVHKIFGGHLRSQVECMQCKFYSNKFDPFLDLSLEIVKADSVRKALAHFTNVELLDGGERQYQCQRCKQKVRATKRLTVHKPPHVLTIHLKRFGSDIPGQKINKKVEFGPTLDLKPFVSDQHEAALKYTLYGVLVHAGWSTRSGHYYCYVRTSSGMWHSLDDNQVLQVSEKTVLAQKAYMLFYVRDRSSASKGLLGVDRKDNASTFSPEKVNSRLSFVMSGVDHSGTMERISSISKCSLAIPKSDDDSHSQPGSAMTVRDPLSKETSYLQKNVNNIQKEAPLLQNSSLVMRATSCLQTDTCSSKVLQRTTLSTDPTKLSLQDSTLTPLSTSSSDRTSHLGNNSVAETSHVHNVILKPESSQNSYGKSQFPDGLNGKMSSGIIAAHLDKPSPLKPRSEERNRNPLEQIGIHVNGSAVNGISQSHDALCKIGTITTSANIEPVKVFSQSIHMYGHIQKDPLSITTTEHQTTGQLMSNLQHYKGGENLLNSTESGQINKFFNTPNNENVCLQKDCFSVKGRKNTVGDCSQAKQKPKKLVKSLIKGPYLGRNLLFLKSLQLRRSKKSKKYSKRYVNSKNLTKHEDDLISDDHGASTSEAARLVGTASVRSSKKRSRESSSNGNDIKGVKDVTYSTGNIVHVNGINVESSSKNADTLATSEQPKDSVKPAATQCDTKDKNAHNKSPAQYSDLRRLMNIKETIVPRWDDIEVRESDGFRDAQSSSIGYVLDEWDEEYDRGKRKKVNKSKRNFGGPNPFQEHANMKIQEKMKMGVNQMYSGNQPLRI